MENRLAFIESSHDALEQYGRRNNLVISGIPDSVQDSELESTVTSILSDIDVNVESLDLLIGSFARKHYLTGSNWRERI